MSLTATDQFCGAGGSSIGAELAGVKLTLAMNHWRCAIETHGLNFPHAEHACVDIASTDPRAFPSTDILITSPECRAHSYARGRPKNDAGLFQPDEAGDRSRATMWDVPRFAEVHRYRAIVVENVTQAVEWGPRERKGSQFRAWLMAMEGLGYEHRLVSYNSMCAGAPQSRDRLYVVFWREGERAPDLDFTVESWCPDCERLVHARQVFKRVNPYCGERVGRYGQQYVYSCPTCAQMALPVIKPASTVIDWSLPAPRIGDRDRPLAEATMERIRRGLDRLGEQSMVVPLGHGADHGRLSRARSAVTEPWPTQTTRQELAVVIGKRENARARTVGEPLPTVTSIPQIYLLIAPSFCVPVSEADLGRGQVVTLRRNAPTLDAAEGPCPTVTAGGNHIGLLVSNYGPGSGGRGPGGWTRRADHAPVGTITTADGHALVVPFRRGNGAYPAGARPLPTATTIEWAGVATTAPAVEDCGFRMLEPHEIARAMVMHEHADGGEYRVLGTKRDQVRQYGNAVTPPVMRMLVERLSAALGASA